MRELVSSVIRSNSQGLRAGNLFGPNWYYDNQGFSSRATSVSSRRSIAVASEDIDANNHIDDQEDIEVDEESFRSDLERDSVHSSMSERPSAPAPRSSMEMRYISHEERYAQLQRQSQRRSSADTHHTVRDYSQITSAKKGVGKLLILLLSLQVYNYV